MRPPEVLLAPRDHPHDIRTVVAEPDGAAPARPGDEVVRVGDDRSVWVHRDGESAAFVRIDRRAHAEHRRAATERGGGLAAEPDLRSPMPGTVTAVFAVDGDSVEEGDAIVAIEAMKMEHRVVAAFDGTVRLGVAVGDLVSRDQAVARIEPHPVASEPESDRRPSRGRRRERIPPGMRSTMHDLTDEEQQLYDMVCEFADTVVAPQSYEADRTHTLSMDVVAQMGELGLFGLPFPEEVGGQGGDYMALCLAIEALARVDQSIAITLEAAVGLGAMPIYRHGTDEQKAEYLPDLVAGRALAGFGLTESEAGSDAGATRTTAVLDGDEWVINGSKQFITNSGTPITKFVTVTAVTGERTRPDGSVSKELSTIIVPNGTPGFTVAPGYDKSGWRASDTHPLTFDDVRVPAANLLGERGRGFANFLRTLDEGRIAIAALATGVAQGCLDEALSYAKTRNVFGVPIASHQYVAFTIAQMQARVYTARLAWHDAARRVDAGLPFKKEAAMAKLVSSDAAMLNSRDATQVFGGMGFMNESLVARHYRDSKILEIGEGTNEVQLMVIARELGIG